MIEHRLWRVSLAILLLIAGCQPAEKFEWHLQSYATPTSIDYLELVNMTESVRVMSGGRLMIHPHSGGEITGGSDIYSAVKERRIEMGNGWPNWWSGHHPAWAVMNADPYEFMNIDASLLFFISGQGSALANELSAPDGIIWLPAWWAGMEFGLLSKEPILGLSDLKGKKVRIGPGLPSEVLAAASGAASIPLVPDEIRPALTNGDIDAIEWTTTSGAWDLGIGDIAKHAIVPAIWQPAVLSDFLINQAAYNELPPDLQAILMNAIRAFTLTTTAKAKTQDFLALDKFKQNGTQLVMWSDEDLKIWKKTSDDIHKQYRDKDAFTDKLIESKDNFKQQYDAYYKIFGSYEQ